MIKVGIAGLGRQGMLHFTNCLHVEGVQVVARAYKRALLESFDPYKTGSDDCGSVISLLEKNLARALGGYCLVPLEEFSGPYFIDEDLPNCWVENSRTVDTPLLGRFFRFLPEFLCVFWKGI
jgi:hypothetical protein